MTVAAQRAWYLPLWQAHGDTAGGVGWSAAHQQTRFAALTAGWDTRKPIDVLDVGCGLGHLYDYLTAQGVVMRYRGLDCVPELVDAANARLGVPVCVCQDVTRDPLPPCDCAVACGTFSVALGDEGLANREMLTQVVSKMLACARQGISFECLLDTHSHPVAGQHYYAESWLREWLQQVVAPWGAVTVTTDLLPGVAIVQLTKEV